MIISAPLRSKDGDFVWHHFGFEMSDIQYLYEKDSCVVWIFKHTSHRYEIRFFDYITHFITIIEVNRLKDIPDTIRKIFSAAQNVLR